MEFVQLYRVQEAYPLGKTPSYERAGDAVSASQSKLLGLELLRFASALAVLVVHYNQFAFMAGMPAVPRSGQALYWLLWPFYEYGQFGVHVFWGISGFIFFRKYGERIHAGIVGAKQFFWLRFSRLYPLHLATLLFVALLQHVHYRLTGADFVDPSGGLADFVRQLFMASNWGSAHNFTFNSPIWSVSAEVAVYAAFFALLRRFAPTRNLCFGLIVVCLGLQLFSLRWMSVGCATYFFAGGLASLMPSNSARPAAVILMALIAVAYVTGALGDLHKMPMIMLIAVPCLLILVSRDLPSLTRFEAPIQFAGNLTYASYLLQFPLQLLLAVMVATYAFQPPITAAWFLGSYLAVTLIFAVLSYRWFELPAQRWLRWLTLQNSRTA